MSKLTVQEVERELLQGIKEHLESFPDRQKKVDAMYRVIFGDEATNEKVAELCATQMLLLVLQAATPQQSIQM